MPAKSNAAIATRAVLLLLLLTGPVIAEDKQQPDMDLLEYLGEWAGSDKDWSDPVDILDVKMDDTKDNSKAKASEKQK